MDKNINIVYNIKMDNKFKFLQKLVLLIDSIIIFSTLIFIIIISIMEGELFSIPYRYANIFWYLFLYILGKIFIGFIAFILLFIKYKKNFVKTSFGIIIPWIIFTVLILFFDILLIKYNIYRGKELFIYIIIVSIGILIWNKVLLYKIELKKSIMILYSLFSVLINYLIIFIIYIISCY